MTATLAYKLGHTRRIYGTASGSTGAFVITACTIEVKLIVDATIITLSLGAGVGFGVADGSFYYDVNDANLAALGYPSQVTTVINIWNPDNTLLLGRTGVMAVTY